MAGFLLVSSQQELSMPSSCHWVCAFGWAPGGLFTELQPLWRGRTHMASKSRCCGRLQGSPNTGSTMQWTIIRPRRLEERAGHRQRHPDRGQKCLRRHQQRRRG